MEPSIVMRQKTSRTILYIAGSTLMSVLCLLLVLLNFLDSNLGPFGLFTANSIFYFLFKLILLAGVAFPMAPCF